MSLSSVESGISDVVGPMGLSASAGAIAGAGLVIGYGLKGGGTIGQVAFAKPTLTNSVVGGGVGVVLGMTPLPTMVADLGIPLVDPWVATGLLTLGLFYTPWVGEMLMGANMQLLQLLSK